METDPDEALAGLLALRASLVRGAEAERAAQQDRSKSSMTASEKSEWIDLYGLDAYLKLPD